MTDLSSLSFFSYQLVLLLAVIISKCVISHFTHHEPLRFFQFYCQILSNKVNKEENSAKQQTIAGLIAILITLVPILVILWLFESFIVVDFLWQFFLLYLAIGSFGLSGLNKSIAQAIVAKQNYLAKQTLKPMVLRETETLSNLGLSKTAIEMKLLRTLQLGYAVAVIFVIAGPLVSLTFRLLLEMHYCWNSKLEKYHNFGQYSTKLVRLLQWFPVRIFSLLLLFSCIGQNFWLFWRLSRQHFFQLNNNIALLLLALSLEVRLGGVAIYKATDGSHKKLRKVSFNDLARQPQVTDIIHANNKINYLVCFSILLMTLSASAIELVIANI